MAGAKIQKVRKSAKPPAAKKNRIVAALADLRDVYSDLAAAWPSLSQAQRQAVLDHSPTLRSVLAFAAQFGGV